MAYEKRLCVLKQMKKGFTADGGALSGVVFAERLGSELTVTPRISGLSALSEGRYALALRVGAKNYCFEWKGNAAVRVPDAPSLKDGFSVLVVFVKGEAEPVAFGTCGTPVSPEELLARFRARQGRAGKKDSAAPAEAGEENGGEEEDKEEGPSEDERPFRDAAAAGYDDEAIASADYYVRGGAQDEDAPPSREAEAGAGGDAARADDEDGVPPFHPGGGGLAYYRHVAPKLKEAFRRYPPDGTLSGVFPHSEWVRTEKALLGVIYGDGVPKYLCVAMEEVSDEAKDAALFVPVSVFSEEEGIFVVFQDAGTGEYVKVENA